MPASQAVKDSAWLVKFSYEGGPALYTDWTSDITFGGEIYSSTPALDLDIAENTGGLNEGPTRIEMPLDSFSSYLSDGMEKPPVEVEITEILTTDAATDSWVHYIGDAHIAARNPKGRSNVVRIECKTVKSRLEAPLGVEADQFCKNIFGGNGCFFDLEAAKEDAVVTDISGQQVTVSGMSAAPTADWFAQGSMSLGGIRIMVRDWNQDIDSTVFYLARNAPPTWQGKTVIVRPGCKKQVISCRERNNEEFFFAIGFGMPSYNPNLENP